MKALLVCVALLFSTQLLAGGGDKGGGKWEERKAKKVEMMTKRIERITKNKACVEAATTKDAFKVCMKTIKAERKEWKNKHKK